MPTCPRCRTRYPDPKTTCDVDGDILLPDEAFTGVDMDLASGRMVGEYRIEKKIGEGGFGSVYKAVHPLIGKAAAIKVLNRQYSSNPQMVTRFISEARAVNQIRHRNIVDIFSFGSLDDGRQYYVMALLEGMPLDQYMRERGRLSPAEALPILRGVGRALDAAHGAGIAHRDLKPENIFLEFDEDKAVHPKLLDFGIAKLLTDEARGGGSKTRTGMAMGTPHFMSPEQFRGKDVDHRTDVYSFGVMVFQMLTGRLPFDGDDLMDLMVKQSTGTAPRMSSVCPDVPSSLDAPVLRMMEKTPDRRPSKLGIAVDELVAAMNAPAGDAASGPSDTLRDPAFGAATYVSALPPAAQIPSAKTFQGTASEVSPPRRPRRIAAFVVLPALALVGIGLAFTASSRRHKPVVQVAQTAQVPSVSAPSPTAPPPSVAPSASPEAAPAEVQITVRGAPDGASIVLDGRPIGVVPGPVPLKKSDEKVKLTLKADGYSAAEIELVPDESRTVSIKMIKSKSVGAQPKAQKQEQPREIENPFK